MNHQRFILICLMTVCLSLAFAAETAKVTVDVRAEPLSSVLQSLEKQSGVKITLQGEGRTPVTLTLRDVDLETAIKYVCRSAITEYKRTDEGFAVNNPNPLPPELERVGAQSPTGDPNLLLMADFTAGGTQNNLGGYFGTFNGDNTENACHANLSFVNDDALGRKEGKAVRIDFENPSRPYYSGFWLSTNPLENEDLGRYDRLGFWAKAEGINTLLLVVKDRTAKDNYTPTGVGEFTVTGLTDKWKRFEVLFKDFQPQMRNGHLNWKSIRQFVFVCVDENKPSKGALFLDEVYCSKGPRQMSQ